MAQEIKRQPARELRATVTFVASYGLAKGDGDAFYDINAGSAQAADRKALKGLVGEMVKVKSGDFDNILMGTIDSVEVIGEGEIEVC